MFFRCVTMLECECLTKLFCPCELCPKPLWFRPNLAAELDLLFSDWSLQATLQEMWAETQWDERFSRNYVQGNKTISCNLSVLSVKDVNILTSFLSSCVLVDHFLFLLLSSFPRFPSVPILQLFSYIFMTFGCSSIPVLLLFLETRPQASESATHQLITSTNVSGTLSRPLWQQSARTWPAGTTSHWRWSTIRK